MDMGGAGNSNDHACKISMLWNWYTIDACFLSTSWHIRTPGMFAGSCIGIAMLVVSLELLRRLGKEYDTLIIKQYKWQDDTTSSSSISSTQVKSYDDESTPPLTPNLKSTSCCNTTTAAAGATSCNGPAGYKRRAVFRASPMQQFIRALIHAAVFGVAYIIMLLAMYYNGYIIISIIVGAGLGKFVCDWLVVGVDLVDTADTYHGAVGVGSVEEATVCCG